MNDILQNIIEAERGGNIDLGKALRALFDGSGGGLSLDAMLAALAALDASQGVLYQNGVDTLTKIPIGTGPGTIASGDHVHGDGGGVYIEVVASATAGNIPLLTVDGELANSAYSPASFAASSHTHSQLHDPVTVVGTPTYLTFTGQEITQNLVSLTSHITGNLPVTHLGSGTSASSTTYLRGDMTWVTPSSGLVEATISQYRSGTAAVAISPSIMYSSEAPVVLTDAATVAVDLNAGRVFKLTLGGNRAIGQPTNQAAGQSGEIFIFQDGTGGWELTWHADFKFEGNPPVIPTAIGARCIVAYRVTAANEIQCSSDFSGTHDAVTLAGTPNYLTLANQVVTLGSIDLATDVSGNLPVTNLASGTGASVTTYFRGDGTWATPAGGGAGITMEDAQDAVGTILTDTASVNFTYDDATPTITADVIFGSTSTTVAAGDHTHDALYISVIGTPTTGSFPTITAGGELVTSAFSSASFGTAAQGTLADSATQPGDNISTLTNDSAFITSAHNHDGTYINVVTTPTAGNFPILTAGGELDNSTYSQTSFATSGHTHAQLHDAATLAGTPDYLTIVGQVITRGLVNLTTDITGNLPVAHLGSGTSASAATFLRGDMTWVTPAGGGLTEATASEFRDGIAAVAISPSVYYAAYAPVTLTDAATIAVDMDTGLVFKVTITADRLMGNPTNEKAGQSGEFWIFQDGTGGWDLTWDTEYTFIGAAPIIPQAPGGVCVVAYRVMASGEVRCSANTGSLVSLTADVSGILPIANGGTSASTAATAFTALKQDATATATGVVELATNAEVTTGTDTTRAVTPAGAASRYQPLDADLTAIAGLTSAADALPYFTGAGTASVTTLTAFGRDLIDSAADSNARTTLGLGTIATLNTITLTTNITGNLPVSHLGSGTGADNTTYLRGDMTWVTPAGGGGITLEEAQDGIGTILVDSASINFTYTDATPDITAVAIFGSTTGTVCQGDDARLSDARTPTAHNHDASYVSVVTTPTTGNFPILTAGGELDNSTYSNASFATAAQGTLAGTALQAADVDDTPVNGVTTAPVSSNWAFDHAADNTAHGGQVTVAGTPDYITLAGQVLTRGLIDLTTDITGNLPVAHLGSGTGADNTTYLRGDMTWVTPAGGGGITLEEAQDGIGTILVDSASINFTYTDATPDITAVAIFGSTTGTVCQGDDARLSDARTPTSHDHSANKLAQANTHESADTDVGTTSLHHTIGAGANQAAAGNHNHSGTYQPLDAELTAVAGLTSAADTLPYFTGIGTADVTTLSAFARTFLDDAADSNVRTTLGLGTIATQSAATVAITGGSITGITDLAIADGGTGASTAGAAFTALKQDASETATGVVELATVVEVATGTDTTRAVTAAGVAGGFIPKVTTPTAGNFAVLTAGGVFDNSTYSNATFATAAQGTLAGTALQPADVDDTPVDAATTAPVSSNWAFDHAADNTAHGGQVTLAGTPDYITISGQVITRGLVVLTTDISGNLPVAHLGSGTGADATTYLRGDMTWVTPAGGGGITLEEAQDGIGTILTDSTSINFTYNDATPDITAVAIFGTSAGTVAEGNHNHSALYQPLDGELTALAGLTSAADTLPYFTGAGTADVTTLSAFARTFLDDAADSNVRTTLGLGTIATQASSNVTISGGAITGITDLAIADGGTGASTAAAAFTALKQDASETATGVVELATNAEVVTGTDTTRAVTSAGVAARYQPLDGELTALAGLTSAANTLPYFTGSGTAGVTTLSAFARTFIDDAADSDVRTTLGLGTMATQAASAVAITGGTVTGITDLAIADGGTGSGTAAAAFTALKQAASTTATGVVELATDGENAANVVVQGNDARLVLVTLAGTPDYLTISGQVITRALIDLTTDVTGLLPAANIGVLTTATESGTTRTNTAADRNQWVRWTSTSAKTFTITTATPAAGDVWQGINAGANGTLTLVGSGVTLTGTLTFASLKSYSVRFVSTSAADVVGGA